MPHIKYTGLSHFRELAAADFKRLGVEGQKKLTWARDEVLEVSNEVADKLQELLGDEFEKVRKDYRSSQAQEPATDSDNEDEVDHPDGHVPEVNQP